MFSTNGCILKWNREQITLSQNDYRKFVEEYHICYLTCLKYCLATTFSQNRARQSRHPLWEMPKQEESGREKRNRLQKQ